MNRLNICIDIDGTITEPYYWVSYANKYFNLQIKNEDVTAYEICDVLGISTEEANEFLSRHGEEMLLDAQIRKDAKKILWELSVKHNIFYVTARDRSLMNLTQQWFMMNDLPSGELYMLGSHHKVGKAQELNCDIFLEDRYENACELTNAGFEVLLLDCNYNRLLLGNGIQRVFNWEQVSKIIKFKEKNLKIIA